MEILPNMLILNKKTTIASLLITCSLAVLAPRAEAKCEKYRRGITVAKQAHVYEGMPFSEGEEQYLELFYMGVFVGYGKLVVDEPVKHKGLWHNVFAASANTAPSYEVFFEATEKMMTYSLPGVFTVTRFKLEQDEKKILGDHYRADKWIKFDHDKCYAKEIVLEKDKKQVVKRFDLTSGATDILSSFYQVRTRDYKLGKMEKFLIYTSEKTWWAEATAIKEEKIKVPAGEFNAIKISMKTFIGKVAEQKGDLFLWLAKDHPSKPILRIEGEVKIGSIVMELNKFTPGKDQKMASDKFFAAMKKNSK